MKKNLKLERLVFFCDAVLAIAITLLIFNLKLDHFPKKLTFADLGYTWQKFIAFAVSFINLAIFWTNHHTFYSFIKKINITMLRYNLCWLFFIVTIPFSASLVSSYLSNTPAVFIYCLNFFLVTFFQNQIWDYAAKRPEFLNEEITPEVVHDYKLSCNVAMINPLIAIGLSFFYPQIAFFLLFLRLPFLYIARRLFKFNKQKIKYQE